MRFAITAGEPLFSCGIGWGTVHFLSCKNMTKESNSFFLKHFGIGFFAALATRTVLAITTLQSDTLSSDMGLGSSWRLTKHGWQDSTRWIVDSFAPVRTFELIHPLIWAFLIIVLVVAATIWASEEWEFARLFKRPDPSNEDQNSESKPGR